MAGGEVHCAQHGAVGHCISAWSFLMEASGTTGPSKTCNCVEQPSCRAMMLGCIQPVSRSPGVMGCMRIFRPTTTLWVLLLGWAWVPFHCNMLPVCSLLCMTQWENCCPRVVCAMHGVGRGEGRETEDQ